MLIRGKKARDVNSCIARFISSDKGLIRISKWMKANKECPRHVNGLYFVKTSVILLK